MVKNRKLLEAVIRKLEQSKKKRSFNDSLKIFEALWEEAKNLGALPLKDPLEGIASDLRIARALNYKKIAFSDNFLRFSVVRKVFYPAG